MRSRYTAFVHGLPEYLHTTWAARTRPKVSELPATGLPFTRLEIRRTQGGGPFDTEGVVEFAAYSPTGVQHEVSRFIREDGAWVYLDGDLRSVSYTHLTLPTTLHECRSRWSPYH